MPFDRVHIPYPTSPDAMQAALIAIRRLLQVLLHGSPQDDRLRVVLVEDLLKLGLITEADLAKLKDN